MTPTGHCPSIGTRVRALAAAALAVVALSTAAAPAHAYTAEQQRYATETVNLTYKKFLARKSDFSSKGCQKPPSQRKPTEKCRKPAPYDSFDWTSDGCSPPTPGSWKKLFDGPCQLHDFGYRNFGKGLTLGRSEDTRHWIDDRFEAEMKRLCNDRYPHPWQYPNREACFKEAEIIHAAVSVASDWSPPVTPPPPPQHIFHVHNTCADHACGLLVETGPGSGFGGRVIGTLNDGDAANIRCQTVGGLVSGGEGMNDVWDQIDYAGGIAYVSDLYMDTPGDNTPQPHRHFTSSIPRC